MTAKQEAYRRWYRKNRKKAKAYNKRWYRKNRKRARENHRLWYQKNKKKVNIHVRLYRHEMTRKEYDRRLKKQKNRCAICRKIFRQTPHIDHSHKTGKNRGLLCSDCNKGLGFFKDSIQSLENSIEYLKDS